LRVQSTVSWPWSTGVDRNTVFRNHHRKPAVIVRGAPGAARVSSASSPAAWHLRAALPDTLVVVNADNEWARLLVRDGFAVTVCSQARDGMGNSLAWGVEQTARASAWIVALADMPFIRPATIGRVAEAIEDPTALAAPVFRGKRRHPDGFGRAYFELLVQLAGDEGARSILRPCRADTVAGLRGSGHRRGRRRARRSPVVGAAVRHHPRNRTMIDLSEASDAALVREIYRRIQGESELHYYRNYLYRAALRPIYTFFDQQDIDEANIRMRKIPDWKALEAARDEVLPHFPAE
jgi:molybdenum cofactor cytidylyltransferase